MTRRDKARIILRRMWDIQFVAGTGLFLVSIMFAMNEHSIHMIVPLAFNAGVCLTIWIDRFQFDHLLAAAHHLAQVCDQQQTTIQEQRKLLDALKQRVDIIIGETK